MNDESTDKSEMYFSLFFNHFVSELGQPNQFQEAAEVATKAGKVRLRRKLMD